ncbi:hypothetical protein D3C87_1824990 [compost metagenome]
MYGVTEKYYATSMPRAFEVERLDRLIDDLRRVDEILGEATHQALIFDQMLA